MTPSNLPPGVTEGMIPGNRPEDEADEAFFDALSARSVALGFDLPDDGQFEDALRAARDLGYDVGHDDGRAEEQMAQCAAMMTDESGA
jgi:hypothetical protein